MLVGTWPYFFLAFGAALAAFITLSFALCLLSMTPGIGNYLTFVGEEKDRNNKFLSILTFPVRTSLALFTVGIPVYLLFLFFSSDMPVVVVEADGESFKQTEHFLVDGEDLYGLPQALASAGLVASEHEILGEGVGGPLIASLLKNENSFSGYEQTLVINKLDEPLYHLLIDSVDPSHTAGQISQISQIDPHSVQVLPALGTIKSCEEIAEFMRLDNNSVSLSGSGGARGQSATCLVN